MITFYFTIGIDELRPYMPDVPVLLPASSYARRGLKPPALPLHVKQRAADSGGVVATFKWGDYRYTPAQYKAWLDTWHPQWAATMDYCCEDEITNGKAGLVRKRQDRTTDMAHFFWSSWKEAPWAWVPTIQGWEVEEYAHHARAMKPLIQTMQEWYAERGNSHFRVGIGTLCRRASARMIWQVVQAVSDVLGKDVPLHLWGVKLSLFQSSIALPEQIVSTDSAAFWFSHPDGWEAARAEMQAWARQHGKTHRHFLYEVALPRYQAKIEAALQQKKQQILF